MVNLNRHKAHEIQLDQDTGRSSEQEMDLETDEYTTTTGVRQLAPLSRSGVIASWILMVVLIVVNGISFVYSVVNIFVKKEPAGVC